MELEDSEPSSKRMKPCSSSVLPFLSISSKHGTKSYKANIEGVSMIEVFTPDQVMEHITSLRTLQGKTKAEINQAVEHSMSEKFCQLCAVEKLTFEDDETEEWWVQCDKCEAWQHQICALFNGWRNNGGQVEYTCPICYIEEIEKGERMPLPQSAILGAKDLPRTILSDHLEHRLFRSLKHERQERARVQGKLYDEIPGVEEIVVRVVSSVDKKLEVNPHFRELFQEDNYPTELPYKSKAIMLFQKIGGVEVCLFGMYVQEFGSECQPPNQRCVNISCFDSVKYFRTEVKAVTGEALRTFVYHEVLIGYLQYCKQRGFTSCYIWACPPLKGEDNIFYCHPEIQEPLKSDKLRDWHLAMLKKASEENIVVKLTNLYDHFFVSTGECKVKVSAARLPYFDGDYWPGAVEEIVEHLSQSDLSSNASKDLLLMHKLGDEIMPIKDDFIMVHLQHSCTRCCTLMVSGNRWVCKQCKHFQICDECYEAEQKLDEEERHPTGNKDMHTLFPAAITGVPEDTKDKDEILENEFFDARQAFLSLCRVHHNQFDTLRRAKHSSMMMLYHLHHPASPAFGHGLGCEDRNPRSLQLGKVLDALVHSSRCHASHCHYPYCLEVRDLFRHEIRCKIRASGGCLLCQRSWYLLQLHARRCQELDCHAPRCRDLRNHLWSMQHRSNSSRKAVVMEMMRQRAAEVAGHSG